MIKLSTKSRYGLRILLHIAEEGRSGRLAHGREIAARQEITGPYLEQIMIPLKAGQLVKARRGCRGGYELARAAEEITVLEVIELFERGVNLVDCDGVSGKACPRRVGCRAAPVWGRLTEVLRAEARGITLASLMDGEAGK